MSESINWILLSDLHLGLDDQSWFWPRVKHDLFKDISRMADQIGPCDIVFFTGDLVQNGQQAEFDLVNKELEQLWKVLSKTGQAPVFCPIPGNHDLTRPGEKASVALTLTKLWWSDPSFRKTFWKERDCECRKAIDGYFFNYTAWMSKLPVPVLESVKGILPGDFSAVFRKRETELGIIGLNSSFLQLTTGDFKGRLDIHVSQLNAVCGGDPDAWLKKRTSSLLLTHHPPSWLAPEALGHYRQEIYPPGRFLSHLCGHQHEVETLEITEAGGRPRRYRHSPSVFGLEYWSGATPEKRIHGYMAGQYVFDGENSLEKFWPRTATQARHGGLNICADHSFDLRDDDNVVVPLDLCTDNDDRSEELDTRASPPAANVEVRQPESVQTDLQLLETLPDADASRARLISCPRMSLVSAPHHRAIRQAEQSQFELETLKHRSVWLVADWGMSSEEFLAAAFDRFRNQGNNPNVFHLRCDEAEDENTFQSLFPQQFGMSMQAFCGYVASLAGTFLVCDGIHPSLSTGENLRKLQRVESAVLDYCPDLRIVFVSRTPPEKRDIPIVELRPLDMPDVRTYLLNHPDATPSLRDPDVICRLHERSDGLPMHLDRMLRSLKVASLESVLDAEMEVPSGVDAAAEEVPRALVHAVTTLTTSVDKRSKRSLRLLKILSVLPYGETLETLKHYLPTEPFFIENALQLNELGLLDAIPLKHGSPFVEFGKAVSNDESATKLLKVPRQVGWYVQPLLSDDERAEIILAGAERFFGRRWRDGRIKLRTLSAEYREYLGTGAGNEFAVIHHLIVDAKKNGEIAIVRKAAKLGIQYGNRLLDESRYRDLVSMCSGLLQVIGQDDAEEQWSELAVLGGKALRMTKKPADALTLLHGALEMGAKYFDDDQKASIWLNIALAEERLEHVDLAVKAATEVKRLSKPLSGNYLHALSIEESLTLEGEERTKRLTALEKQARDQGHRVVADNIALDLASDMNLPRDKIRLLDRVLADGVSGYNKTRAVVAKARAAENIKDQPSNLTRSDLISLSIAYSYLYSQRLGSLFDQCHEVLWNRLESQGETSQLLRMFRHSSFIWRIQGNEAKEVEYLNRLSSASEKPPTTDSLGSGGVQLEVYYFWMRFKLVITEAIDKKEKSSSLSMTTSG